MGLRLTILGCTGSYPGPHGACSGYLIEGGGERVLLEAGPGSVERLQRHLPLEDLTAVVLTHVHPDHWSDFGVLRTAMRYGLGREGLRTYGTEEIHSVALHLVGHDLAPTIEWTTVSDGHEAQIGPLRLRFSRTNHYVETLAVRIDHAGRSLAFSADTGPAWSWELLGSGIDVALSEASMLSQERRGANAELMHLTAQEAGEMARKAGIARLLLTHLPPGSNPDVYRAEAEGAYGGAVEVVAEGEIYEV